MPPLLHLSRTLHRTRPLTRHLATKLPFAPSPAPPRLPPEEQALFERLQASSTGAFSIPRSTPQINQFPHSNSETVVEATATAIADEAGNTISVEATGSGEELHPDIRRGAKPEFEGDVNPKTGEVGGPKNEPLRWGGERDWSYNGRVTDF